MAQGGGKVYSAMIWVGVFCWDPKTVTGTLLMAKKLKFVYLAVYAKDIIDCTESQLAKLSPPMDHISKLPDTFE